MLNAEQLYFLRSALASRKINWKGRLEREKIQSVLLIRMDEIGDVVLGLPALSALRAALPGIPFTVWCKPLTADLFRHSGCVDEVITQSQHLARHYDLVVDLRGTRESLRIALRKKPLLLLDRGSVRLKYKMRKQVGQVHETKVNWEVLEPLIGPLPDEALQPVLKPGHRHEQTAKLFLQRNVIGEFAVLHTGARKLLRRWSIAKFAALAEALHSDYGLDIVFAGSEDEQRDIERIQEKISFPTYSFAGQGNLLDFAALCYRAKIFIGNDSGPMHLASACGIPVIGLFGPGMPDAFGPAGANSVVIHHKLPCHPCDQVNCVLPDNPCINHIELDEVLAACKQALKVVEHS